MLGLRLKPPDALHLAYAESVRAVFVSTDRSLLNKARGSPLVRISVMDPVDARAYFGQR
jgi:predicted nucleic acid-binding protein